MTTIRTYTTIEQSKKLAEILPLESADMLWEQHGAEPYVTIKPWTTRGKSIGCHCLSCWSLAALLNILPFPVLYMEMLGGMILWCCEGHLMETDEVVKIEHYNNPIDACYELILKLRELNLL